MGKWEKATGDRVMVQVRLPRDLVKTIDHLCVDLDLYRQQLVERLLRDGLRVMEEKTNG